MANASIPQSWGRNRQHHATLARFGSGRSRRNRATSRTRAWRRAKRPRVGLRMRRVRRPRLRSGDGGVDCAPRRRDLVGLGLPDELGGGSTQGSSPDIRHADLRLGRVRRRLTACARSDRLRPVGVDLPVRIAAARRLQPIGIARAAGCAEAPHKNERRRPDGVPTNAGSGWQGEAAVGLPPARSPPRPSAVVPLELLYSLVGRGNACDLLRHLSCRIIDGR